jgi:hypothetical protein
MRFALHEATDEIAHLTKGGLFNGGSELGRRRSLGLADRADRAHPNQIHRRPLGARGAFTTDVNLAVRSGGSP